MKTKIIIALTLIFGSAQLLAITKTKPMKTIAITKSVHINGSIDEVFAMVKYLNNFPKWSPFLEEDPAQKYEVKGQDGETKAQYHWVGNGGKDVGYQEITAIQENNRIMMQCDIQKPFQAKPSFEYLFKPDANGVTVTQNFKLNVKRADNFFMTVFGVKKKMAKTNMRGLELLKIAVEQHQ